MKQIIKIEAKTMTKLADKVAKKQEQGYTTLSGGLIKKDAGGYVATMSL